jgi:hypothetical protein
MADYSNGKIYTIRTCDTDKFYIGATTTTLTKRFYAHKQGYKLFKEGNINYVSSYKLFDIDINNCFIELLELYPCGSKIELSKREGELIRLHKANLVNIIVPCRTLKEFKKDNEENINIIKAAKKKAYQEKIKANQEKKRIAREKYILLKKEQRKDNKIKREENVLVLRENKKIVTEEKKLFNQIKRKETRNSKIQCVVCSKLYSYTNKPRHYRKHKIYLETLVSSDI